MNTPDPSDHALTAQIRQLAHREGATSEDQLAVARMSYPHERLHLSPGLPSPGSNLIIARKGKACVQELS